MTEKQLIESLEIFSHKLKNPLHSVGINLQVLQVRLKKTVPQEKDLFKHLDIVSSEIKRVNDIVLKYLDYLKFDEKKQQQIDLKKLLEGK